MKVKLLILLVFYLGLILIILDSCSRNARVNSAGADCVITLRWNRAYEKETKENVETGLKWAFSFLGAELKKGSFADAVKWNGQLLSIDFTRLGFSNNAITSLHQITEQLKLSREYKLKGGIDIGRFLILTLNSSYPYYSITGVKKTLSEFRSNFAFDPKKVGITASTVSKSHRLLELPSSADIPKNGFIALEGQGSLTDNKFVVKEYEVFDIMQNGQLRFAIYDLDGNLRMAADTLFSAGGKPSKCLWCHEINLNPIFANSKDIEGYYTQREFNSFIQIRSDSLQYYRNRLESEIDYSRTQDHTQTELLYISFMEPSAERLSIEWGIPISEVNTTVRGLTTHTHSEFPFLGILYQRKDVDPRSPFSIIKVPESARELSVY